MRKKKMQVLLKRMEAEYDLLETEMNVYLDNPVGVGEHGDLFQVVEEKLGKMSELEGKMQVLQKCLDRA